MVPLIPENAAAQWQGGTNSLPPHPYSKQQNQQANSMPRLREQWINILDLKTRGKEAPRNPSVTHNVALQQMLQSLHMDCRDLDTYSYQSKSTQCQPTHLRYIIKLLVVTLSHRVISLYRSTAKGPGWCNKALLPANM